MTRFLLSSVLLFFALGTALAVLAAGAGAVIFGKNRLLSLLYCAVSAGAALSLGGALLRQSSGIACAMPASSALVVYGGLTLLQLYFLWDLAAIWGFSQSAERKSRRGGSAGDDR